MERPLEHDDALTPRVQARELHCVLDGLRTRVEERPARLARDRRQRAQPLRELHVPLVGHHRVVGVQEALALLDDRGDHSRMVVPDVRDADPADEVDERVAVDVRDGRSASAVCHDRLVNDQRCCDGMPLAFEDLATARTGDLRADLDHARGRHARQPR